MSISNFYLIPTPLPPMLSGMVGVPENSRYFSLCYYGNKATWSDGRSVGTFSFYGVYQPLISHPALDIYLWRYHLGSDDEYPTNAILCDCTRAEMYVGEYRLVEDFLDSQHPPRQPITLEQWEKIKSQVETSLRTWSVEDFQHIGMKEMFGNINPKKQAQRVELVHWLDQQVDESLLRQYIWSAKSGNYNAIFALKQLEARIDATRKTN